MAHQKRNHHCKEEEGELGDSDCEETGGEKTQFSLFLVISMASGQQKGDGLFEGVTHVAMPLTRNEKDDVFTVN